MFDAPVPSEFLCSITYDIMRNPVETADGSVYERKAIREWLRTHDTSPNTNLRLANKALRAKSALKGQITEWVRSNIQDSSWKTWIQYAAPGSSRGSEPLGGSEILGGNDNGNGNSRESAETIGCEGGDSDLQDLGITQMAPSHHEIRGTETQRTNDGSGMRTTVSGLPRLVALPHPPHRLVGEDGDSRVTYADL